LLAKARVKVRDIIAAANARRDDVGPVPEREPEAPTPAPEAVAAEPAVAEPETDEQAASTGFTPPPSSVEDLATARRPTKLSKRGLRR
jgi:hypothetical protein